MRVVVQRCSEAYVKVGNKITGKIGFGLLILVGIEHEDNQEDIDWLAEKIIKLRIFNDDEGLMNKSIAEVDGEILVVSQFTLHARYKKGARPSFIQAAPPEKANADYLAFCDKLSQLLNKPCEKGIFGAHMTVHLNNDGPVTIVMDTKNKE
jgi:D-tyrosyl-tRNA(Tyr) deacylase